MKKFRSLAMQIPITKRGCPAYMLEKRLIILDVGKASITIAKLGIGMERNGLVTVGKKQNKSTNVNYQQELLARLANT